eukprot:CAMPEP_0173380164 /NCGR_PEP_ID=MMETSP1356-20130122/2901_1 /TAXON_ID=77927 ORGANISM="Hemiselmis virescens, Strain PCC157" /NCGR_SAMPLE_ID=MMETSP1356 /ASSEMBLY_ACC=CAM_ASM_000847 /LENGTH=80 /DNA_ID=CAMNT_0014333667 /DNA_START=430 /DNA_END=673 /DNA_ORIENTATION=-
MAPLALIIDETKTDALCQSELTLYALSGLQSRDSVRDAGGTSLREQAEPAVAGWVSKQVVVQGPRQFRAEVVGQGSHKKL